MIKPLLLLLLLASPAYAGIDAPTPAPAPAYTDAQARAAAPVQSVNSQTGPVVVATVTRKVSAALDASSGTVKWTFATAAQETNGTAASFVNVPTCWANIVSASTTYVFAAPVQTGIDATQVSYNVQAALKLLTISLGALTVWTAPPAGTTLSVTCIAIPN